MEPLYFMLHSIRMSLFGHLMLNIPVTLIIQAHGLNCLMLSCTWFRMIVKSFELWTTIISLMTVVLILLIGMEAMMSHALLVMLPK